MLLFSFAKFADKLSVENVSVRPSSHITALSSSIDSLIHHPKIGYKTSNLKLLIHQIRVGQALKLVIFAFFPF